VSLDCLNLKSCIVCGSNLTIGILLIPNFIKNSTQVKNSFKNIWQEEIVQILWYLLNGGIGYQHPIKLLFHPS
jgi:hypothetical protein